MNTFPMRGLTVWSHDCSLPGPVVVGRLSQNGRFAFSPAWLESPCSRYFNPVGAPPETPVAAVLLNDSLPDSWGRLLVERLAVAISRRDERVPAPVTDADVLAAVADNLRMGAFRFSVSDSPVAFVGDDAHPLPTRSDLAELAKLSRAVELNESLSVQTLAPLVRCASSLGGSRPKASFADADGSLWLAKFPAHYDRRNMGAWECVMMRLAREAGITVPDFDLVNGSIFVSRRFDRTAGLGRRHYFSSRALLGAAKSREARSYLEIIMLIERLSQNRQADVEELYARIAFKMMIGDGDDHLRNHGFLLTDDGWHLSPAFDINPSLSNEHLCLTWDDGCNAFDPAGLIAAAPVWGLAVERAREIVGRVACSLRGWEREAAAAGIASEEIACMRPAFRLPAHV